MGPLQHSLDNDDVIVYCRVIIQFFNSVEFYQLRVGENRGQFTSSPSSVNNKQYAKTQIKDTSLPVLQEDSPVCSGDCEGGRESSGNTSQGESNFPSRTLSRNHARNDGRTQLN